MDKKMKKWILGIAIILAAVAGAVVAVLDDDPATNVDPVQVVEEVEEGVDTIRSADDEEETPAE